MESFNSKTEKKYLGSGLLVGCTGTNGKSNLEEMLQNSLQEFICPISREVMEEPYIASDHFTYDKVSITKWFNNGSKSPMTGLPIQNTSLIPNKNLLFLMSRQRHLTILCSLAHRESEQIQEAPLRQSKRKRAKYEDQSKKEENEKVMNLHGMKEVENIRLLYQKGKFNKKEYKHRLLYVLKKYPRCITVSFSIVGNFIEEKEYSQATKYLNQMKSYHPKSLVPKYLEVELLYSKGLKEKALEQYSSIIRNNLIEEHSEIEIRALIYEINLLGNSTFNKILINGFARLFPHKFFFLGWKICCHLEIEDYDNALKYIDSYISEFGSDGQVLYNQAIIYESRDPLKSIESWTEYLQMEYSQLKAVAFYRRGLLKGELRDPSFVEDLIEAKKEDSNLDGDLAIATIYFHHDDLEKAEEWIDRYMATHQENLSYQDLEMYAEIKAKQKKYQTAIETFAYLIQQNPENAFIYQTRIQSIYLQMLQIEATPTSTTSAVDDD